ncbi:competence protein ComF [[Haemophilus] ducreyi]|uniref:phosphoribosyltransferase family protein n=1 Tax=Haemophilus ducreyi TaxID=730 RepID=UPI000655AC3B|nr:phosphoribosyltransferase family protein [[Haemophilus] ducreyi]AKO36114.1 competence protein ComF [[Haemophilus] ducreyi]AKO37567.1 competence protein ComF [[Haemophilus] ducreyi]AKO40614.1 competence protein ComF [[Haemophilus] ducreyi]AKO42066.1 competence protein ComF [[Haemophilus] ducreyi]
MNWLGFRCFACQSPLAIASHGICSGCVAKIKRHCYCGHCGSLLLENRNACGECLRNEPKWHHLVQVSRYQPPLSDWIHRFKFQHQYWLDRALARLLLLVIKQAQRERQLSLPEVILPVPLFWQRQWQRGFNQAALLAKYLSAWLAIPLDCASLQRIRSTRSQRELSAVERSYNLRGAFYYQPTKKYQSVAIVDDVVTTGSTLNAICSELLKQGVQDIQVWTLART